MQEIDFTSSRTFLYDVVIDSRKRFPYRDAVLRLLGVARTPAWPRLQVFLQDMLYRRAWVSEVQGLNSESSIAETDSDWEKFARNNETRFPERAPLDIGVVPNDSGAVIGYPSFNPLQKPDTASVNKKAASPSLLPDRMQESLTGGNQLPAQDFQAGKKRQAKEPERGPETERLPDNSTGTGGTAADQNAPEISRHTKREKSENTMMRLLGIARTPVRSRPQVLSQGTLYRRTFVDGAVGQLAPVPLQVIPDIPASAGNIAEKTVPPLHSQPVPKKPDSRPDFLEVTGFERKGSEDDIVIPPEPVAALLRTYATDMGNVKRVKEKPFIPLRAPVMTDGAVGLYLNRQSAADNPQSVCGLQGEGLRAFSAASVSSLKKTVPEQRDHIRGNECEYPYVKQNQMRRRDNGNGQVSGEQSFGVLPDGSGLSEFAYRKSPEEISGDPHQGAYSGGIKDHSPIPRKEYRAVHAAGASRAGRRRRDRLTEFRERNYLSTINLGILR